MPTRLACDGPYNGQYIDRVTALNAGYTSVLWPGGEWVWMQLSVLHGQYDENGEPRCA